MIKLFIFISIALSLTFIGGSHPVRLIIIILAQTITLCLLIWTFNKIRWFSYILFLIFLGGLMVLFIYISSLASNEIFSLNLKRTISTYFYSTIILTIILITLVNQTKTQEFSSPEKRFRIIFSYSIALPTITTIIYLLLTLIVVVKITSKYEGPLRNIIFTE